MVPLKYEMKYDKYKRSQLANVDLSERQIMIGNIVQEENN